MTPRDFDAARRELLDLRARWLKGEPVDARMREVAREAADLYNAKAKEVAAKLGMKPRLVSPDRIMKDGRVIQKH